MTTNKLIALFQCATHQACVGCPGCELCPLSCAVAAVRACTQTAPTMGHAFKDLYSFCACRAKKMERADKDVFLALTKAAIIKTKELVSLPVTRRAFALPDGPITLVLFFRFSSRRPKLIDFSCSTCSGPGGAVQRPSNRQAESFSHAEEGAIGGRGETRAMMAHAGSAYICNFTSGFFGAPFLFLVEPFFYG